MLANKVFNEEDARSPTKSDIRWEKNPMCMDQIQLPQQQINISAKLIASIKILQLSAE